MARLRRVIEETTGFNLQRPLDGDSSSPVDGQYMTADPASNPLTSDDAKLNPYLYKDV